MKKTRRKFLADASIGMAAGVIGAGIAPEIAGALEPGPWPAAARGSSACIRHGSRRWSRSRTKNIRRSRKTGPSRNDRRRVRAGCHQLARQHGFALRTPHRPAQDRSSNRLSRPSHATKAPCPVTRNRPPRISSFAAKPIPALSLPMTRTSPSHPLPNFPVGSSKRSSLRSASRKFI